MDSVAFPTNACDIGTDAHLHRRCSPCGLAAEPPSSKDIRASEEWLQRRTAEYAQDGGISDHDLQDLLSHLKRRRSALFIGAGVEPQIFVPPGLLDEISVTTLLKAASSWEEFVTWLAVEFISRFHLNQQFRAVLAQPEVQAADVLANQLAAAAGNLGALPPTMYIAHFAGLLLDRWQVNIHPSL